MTTNRQLDLFTRQGVMSELNKVYFCPVFSTHNSPNHVFDEFCHDIGHKSKHWIVF